MGNEVATQTAGLPANLGNMATALQAAVASSGADSGNDLYLKMSREGEWLYGAEETEVEEGAIIAVNPMGFKHGWTAWGTEAFGTEGQNVGEVMAPADQPAPLDSDLPEVKGEWSKCVSVQMRITNGEDEGVQLLWKTNSHGGRKAWSSLLQRLIARIQAGETAIVPLVTLGSDSYKHKTYGKTYTPEIEIVDWTTMDGAPAPQAIEADEPADVKDTETPEEEAPPRRRRRRNAA